MKCDEVEYNELESFLRNWRSLSGSENYDFVGMFHLFRACMLNLMQNATEDDWSTVDELLEPEERQFLLRLAHGFHSKSD